MVCFCCVEAPGMSAGAGMSNGFATTPWSLVLAAGSLDGEGGRRALGELVRLYKPALLRYLRKKFCSNNPGLADELFSAFVERILVGKELIGKARPREGHQFRRFILTALHRFAVSELRRLQAQKRQPAIHMQSLEELIEHDGVELATVPPADFDVAWGLNVVAEALRRMKEDCIANGKLDIWSVFDQRLRAPILEGARPMPYKELVERLGFDSPAQAYNALVLAKRKFEQHLRDVISGYVADWAAVETELRELHVILAHASSATVNSESEVK